MIRTLKITSMLIAISAVGFVVFLVVFGLRGDRQIEEFLKLKHLFAIRAALASFSGKDPAGVDDTCTISSVSYDGDDTIIDAEIDIKLLSGQIEACTPP